MNYPNYSKVYQICYLPELQMSSPREMYNDIYKQKPGLITKFELQSVLDWNSVMDVIIANTDSGHIPILHLDMHGVCNGFGRDSINVIAWDMLIEMITKLNKACDGKLFLSLNICKGLSIYYNLANNTYPLSLKTIGSFEDIYTKDSPNI